ncbi:MAG: ribonuclease HI [Halomonas sp.]|nr:ribonuclease HI [Halomonas sp.]MCC5881906.1 ribonuclease HI [Halomonas sp.]
MNIINTALPTHLTVTLYTDGSCINNGSPFAFGGWAVVLEYPQEQRRLSGKVEPTTSNRMELTAIIEGLKAIRSDWSEAPVIIFTDSNYVAQGCNLWRHNWKKNGWRNSQRKPVENLDLWQELDELLSTRSVDIHWVKGHNGHPMNELADKMAVVAAHGHTFDLAHFQPGDTRDHLDRCGIPEGGLFGGVVPA